MKLTITAGLLSVAGLALIAYALGGRIETERFNQPQNKFVSSVPSEDSTGKVSPAESLTQTAKAPAPPVAVPDAPADQVAPEFPYTEVEVKARLAQVAQTYAEQIQYPSFSRPITDRTALEKYLPNQSSDVSAPLDPNDPNSPTFSLKTDKVTYFVGEPILALVSVQSKSQIGGLSSVAGRLVEQGQALQETQGSASGKDYLLHFTTDQVQPRNPSGELRVVVNFSLNGQAHEIGTPITLVDSVAEVGDVGQARVNEEYLEIPVDITARKPGYHQLSANLYDELSGKPVVHLSAEHDVRSTQDTLVLKAHIRALKAAGSSGPYQLRDVSLERMPAPPEFTTEYGRASDAGYPVAGFPFDAYKDIPYVDEDAEERLAFLRDMGAVNP
ncbi:MAG: hypothetical protein IPM37_14590 [Hahellaceae bacterium]|nr:hypothetical protein [Hahellaceae bacterium]